MRIALVTDRVPHLAKGDDAPLELALRALGARPEWVIWDDGAVDWGAYDAALLRSPWDYIQNPARFGAWVQEVDTRTRLFNPARVVLPNLDKRYLRRFESAGVPVCPTLWVEPGQAVDLCEVAAARGWSWGLIKPAVGAGASGTRRVKGDWADAQAHLDGLAREGAVLVQPYLRSVEQLGEVSLVLVEGELTHAVVKRPVPGDYRVQAGFGASDAAWTPDEAERALARRVLEVLPEVPLYARVDVLRGDDGEPVLNELELTEPALFFPRGPGAAERLAQALLRRIRG